MPGLFLVLLIVFFLYRFKINAAIITQPFFIYDPIAISGADYTIILTDACVNGIA
jgi:hypothetical protein